MKSLKSCFSALVLGLSTSAIEHFGPFLYGKAHIKSLSVLFLVLCFCFLRLISSLYGTYDIKSMEYF